MTRLTRIENELPPRSKHNDANARLQIIGIFEILDTDKASALKMYGITKQTLYNWRQAFDRDG